MSIQIANPVVVEKVNRLAEALGLSKTALINRALDALLDGQHTVAEPDALDGYFRQFDQLPNRAAPIDPMEWDDLGLPR
jgi:antitoxin VapB